ncbi:desulfoferrodoxin [Candidatus Woesearchaeota archaeon]|nr:desulfoferrodoxin [Candidatus Woesearchaeota archaeon]MBW3017376.1 desulfoferrodoxin [Candidatus Woesearchaeota archaeon]
MTNVNEVYKCEICGNVVSVEIAGAGTLVCCGKPMELLHEKTVEQEGKEKHVPVVEAAEGKVTVKVGSVPHPMEEAHFIQFVQLMQNGKVVAEKQFMPGDKPEAVFCLDSTEGVYARELCNLHGLWKN